MERINVQPDTRNDGVKMCEHRQEQSDAARRVDEGQATGLLLWQCIRCGMIVYDGFSQGSTASNICVCRAGIPLPEIRSVHKCYGLSRC